VPRGRSATSSSCSTSGDASWLSARVSTATSPSRPSPIANRRAERTVNGTPRNARTVSSRSDVASRVTVAASAAESVAVAPSIESSAIGVGAPPTKPTVHAGSTSPPVAGPRRAVGQPQPGAPVDVARARPAAPARENSATFAGRTSVAAPAERSVDESPGAPGTTTSASPPSPGTSSAVPASGSQPDVRSAGGAESAGTTAGGTGSSALSTVATGFRRSHAASSAASSAASIAVTTTTAVRPRRPQSLVRIHDNLRPAGSTV
jgi:hypothetical protein